MRVDPTTAAIKTCLPRPSVSGRLGYARKDDDEQRKSPEQDQCVTFPHASGPKKMMAQ
jgi:hypothetical protein